MIRTPKATTCMAAMTATRPPVRIQSLRSHRGGMAAVLAGDFSAAVSGMGI
jgi:hypothetical protein